MRMVSRQPRGTAPPKTPKQWHDFETKQAVGSGKSRSEWLLFCVSILALDSQPSTRHSRRSTPMKIWFNKVHEAKWVLIESDSFVIREISHLFDCCQGNWRMSLVVAEQPVDELGSPVELSKALRLTAQMFYGAVSVERMSDPESPRESWLVLTVEATGEPQEIVRRQCEWPERVAREFPGQFPGLRLSICPHP